MAGVYDYLLEMRAKRGGGFLLLIDPDRIAARECLTLAEAAEECGVDAVLIGTSFTYNVDFPQAVRDIKNATGLPVIVFPGSSAQVTGHADAILFSCLISGRNPHYLIEEQVRGAPVVKRHGIETIPTGYMLIESGSLTSVQYLSGSLPIPRDKHDIACAHALAAQYLGMKLVYLEAGSGARRAVPEKMVERVSSTVDIPVIVGGGLKTPDDCAAHIEAGASFVVMGNIFEREPELGFLREVVAAAHPKEPVSV
jgi:phosphoglycerol geranylgeranyltransferase